MIILKIHLSLNIVSMMCSNKFYLQTPKIFYIKELKEMRMWQTTGVYLTLIFNTKI